MEKENKNEVCIGKVDGMPYINRYIVEAIEKSGLVFVWESRCFKAKRVKLKVWEVCWECRAGSVCDGKLFKICKALDYYRGGLHMLELVENHV
jgi:hypothetical protein